MIQQESYLKVADNTGAKELKTSVFLAAPSVKYASIGDVIVASVRKATPGGSRQEGRRGQGRYRPHHQGRPPRGRHLRPFRRERRRSHQRRR